jgi:AbrB family looped-hinge helix DNA binding protein
MFFSVLPVSMEVTMSSKGQIVLPLRIRKMFGLKTGEKLIVDVENRDIKLTPKTVDITTLVGSVKPGVDRESVRKKIQEERDSWR